MDIENISQQLKQHFPFFEDELRLKILQNGIAKTLNQGEKMIQEGEYIKSFPLVIEGCLRICRLDPDGRELLIYYLNQGSVCTMSLTCCMKKQKSNIVALAEKPSTIISVPVEYLEAWMSEYKSWKTFMMYSFQSRFEELLNTLDSVAFMQMDQRLEKFLMDWFNVSGKTEYKGSHQDIASNLTARAKSSPDS